MMDRYEFADNALQRPSLAAGHDDRAAASRGPQWLTVRSNELFEGTLPTYSVGRSTFATIYLQQFHEFHNGVQATARYGHYLG